MLQGSLFSTPQIALSDASLSYIPDFLSSLEADRYFDEFVQHLQWRQEHIKMYGRKVRIPRLQAWYGEASAHYQYSGIDMKPLPWTKSLASLKERCELQSQTRFNSVLANLYRDGNDSVGWHADDEPELGTEPVIASISLGVQRHIDFRHNQSKQKVRFQLEHGSLLLMSGGTQQYWQHTLPRSLKVTGARVNLTFRTIKSQL